MTKAAPILITWLVLGLFGLAASPSPSTILFRVSAPSNGRDVIVRPYVAPFLGLKGAEPLPDLKTGDILACSQGETTKHFDDHHDNFVVFSCTLGDSRKGQKIELVLDGLRFADDPYEKEQK